MVSNFFVVKNITNYCPSLAEKQWSQLTGKLADENYDKPGKIHVLLGVSCWIHIIKPKILRSPEGRSIAHDTKLGYVIFETNIDPYTSENPYIGAISKGPSIKRLMDIMQKLWQVEEVPQQRKRTKEEEKCEEVFTLQHSRDKFGKYVLRIPFNDLIYKLGKSKNMAVRQFLAMENKMRKNPEFAEKYRIFMSEYETLGHMNQVWETSESGYYTPHHGILSASKFRVVFNASAKTTSGFSLNETQLVGEKLQRDLVEILMNFRLYKIGVTADIEKMYRQIWIHEDDRKYQKILWRSDEKDPIGVYQLKTVTYGHACAPHCAIRALVQCADDHKEAYPKGARIIKECFYVDDLLTGADDEAEVMNIRREITSLLKKGGMNITKWKTNGTFDESIEFSEQKEQSVLGLCWNLSTDKFFYKLRSHEANDFVWTKRQILSKIGKMYDPNGYLGPVIITGKIIIQALWRSGLDWDEPIRDDLKRRWSHFNDDLQNIGLISVNRWLGTGKTTEIQLHGFCDASEKGYGAVVYTRVKSGNQFHIEILASKSRVSPLKVLTIPRLELCAANLLASLLKTIKPIISAEQQIVRVDCWSDSQVVLQWLTKSSDGLKTYVANRVAHIQTITEELSLNWKWIAGKDNPADLISRGTTIEELHKKDEWWKGPKWLSLTENWWPNQPEITQVSEECLEQALQETKLIHLLAVNETSELIRGKWFKFQTHEQKIVPFLDAYGDWRKLLGVMTVITRAVHRFAKHGSKRVELDSAGAEILAEKHLIRMDQARTFHKEINAVKDGDRGLLAKLVVVWDPQEKFLRVDGRIRSENLTRDEQFPILLSKAGALAPLLIRDAHLNNGHAGTQWILQYLRKRFWITGARRLAKGLIQKCPICFKLRMKQSDQLMAELPIYRTTPVKAFFRTGVDYAGPVTIRSNLGRSPRLTKAWIAVFVCLVTRAIHLELVSDASTPAFIAALRRLISRRGTVAELISDNATNFVGANNFLTAISQQLNSESHLMERQFNIRWRFMTPGAPHQGGIYEAAVKAIKYHLTRIISDRTLTYEEYATVLCQVEALVNSRPIAPLPDDPTSLNALTPGHFLIGEALVRIPDEQTWTEVPSNRLDRWKILQQISQQFWARWQNEYLTTLTNRTKWLTEKRNFKIGDLVVVRDENLPPIKWKLARIQEVLPGADGLIRSVVLRTSTGIYKRPINKLGLLIENEE